MTLNAPPSFGGERGGKEAIWSKLRLRKTEKRGKTSLVANGGVFKGEEERRKVTNAFVSVIDVGVGQKRGRGRGSEPRTFRECPRGKKMGGEKRGGGREARL